MGQSLVSNNLHIVFSTKERLPLIKADLQPKMWGYLAGVTRGYEGIPYAINGTADHVHLLIATRPATSIAKIVSVIKANSSRWANEHGIDFRWQRGYAAFSVSASNLNAVTAYIARQEEHHRRRDFKQELIALLEKHRVPYDPRYIFD